MKVGSLTLDHKVILAPMSGVTDWPFRRMVRQLDGGLVVSEMVASEAIINGVKKEMRKLSTNAAEEFPFALQLAGWDPAMMGEATRIACDLGAAMIDLNLGCPARKVTGKLSGSALMRDEGTVAAIFRAVMAASDRPVTVKMRLGWDDHSKNAPVIARMAADHGLAMITVHGRTRCQFYKGDADWLAVAEVVDAVDLPVAVNGDITSPETARAALEASGAEAVMIGRAAIGKPWLLGQINHWLRHGVMPKDPDIAARHAVMRSHLDLMLSHYGSHGLRLARKHVSAYASGLPYAAEMRQIANNTTDANMVFAAMDDWFARCQDMDEAA
jgi:tRNA-dihydrouridine synthase B